MRSVYKTYTRQFMLAMLGYMVCLLISVSVLRTFDEAFWRYPVALLPVVPIAYGVWAYARLLSRIDELQQRIHLSGLAFAVGVTGLLTLALGLLEVAGMPSVSMIAVFPMLTTFWGIGLALATRRYT